MEEQSKGKKITPSLQKAFKFIILLGIVSLLSDMTYEGARSITGPFLALLGASGAVVGFVAGLGELLGYGVRLISGYLSDRTGKYWPITILGYILNLFAVPLLALAGNWQLAAILMITERVGKAIRTPARDAMLSHATSEVGRGWGFGLHEAMDQIGAIAGPLIVALVLYLRGGYKTGFAILFIPAILAITVLAVARLLYPTPKELEATQATLSGKGLPRIFWLYLVAVAFIAAGYVDYPLIAYHLGKGSLVSSNWIPILYAIAMGADALAALIFGYLFDRIGIYVLAIAGLVSSLFAPLVFLGSFAMALVGMVIWGIGMGAQESVLRAAVANMISIDRRGTAYGVFNTGYGIFWFLGSALMGMLYDLSAGYVVAFSVATQMLSVLLMLYVGKNTSR
ncbi:Major facilitator superfamily [Moorella glycerini]|uniref:Major Facilitator Superfamily protein n=1 Tax=Neomoorella stamsii TaxID=1266720 RepID=A0A9X7J2V8_9FIRM|nr:MULTISPECIES: MFS transporter [Moorella]PRR72776.1 Major Facilitator Superfamily protein [Moorella stamsii]CEP68121.1 Major facilitator superfamily [Moorella glycerini]